MSYYCNNCKKTISKSMYSYSKDKFHRPLCWTCQKKERVDLWRSSGIKRQKPAPVKREADFGDWIEEWKINRKLTFSMEPQHFFLDGSDLDDLTKQIIKMAEEAILVANPFIEECYITDYLIRSAKNKVRVEIVTRQPTKEEKSFLRKTECHSKLTSKGITLHYDNQIHSKIITVDNKVAIVSSMNFYSGSSGGFSKESGIVSIDRGVVESASSYIKNLFDA